MPYHLGSIFSEQIIKENRLRRSADSAEEEDYQPRLRIWFFVTLLFLGLGLLLSRLFVLTVIQGGRYRKLAQGNYIRETKITAPRGIIYDRDGTALVRNIPSFIASAGEVYFENVPAAVSAQFIESVARDYVFGDLFAQSVGFVGEVGQEELGKYKLGDLVGKMGIEKSYDSILRGEDGKLLYEVDALGNKIRNLGRVESKVGKNLILTLLASLQKVIGIQMRNKKGAVIVSDPKTGEILALYSSPSFDANLFIRNKNIPQLLNDADMPLYNRAISGLYPPGSTFKIVTSVAALESGAINKDTKIEDTGILTVGSFSFGNWYFNQYGKKEGMLDIVGAIRRSNDIFFYKVGEFTGIETIAGEAKKMGLGSLSGIDIGGEEKGLMPDPEWQKETRGENWYLGNTYHVAIGQGDILTTPLQVNLFTNIIANDGKLCQPHLVKDTVLGKPVGKQDKRCKDLELKKETIQLIKEGMKEACQTGGTGWPLFGFKIANSKLKVDGIDFIEPVEASGSAKNWVEIPVACKTGTAEFGPASGSAGSGLARTHAWFTSFAPVVNPQISVTVLVEGGGEGSSVAAPIAKKIYEEWFGK